MSAALAAVLLALGILYSRQARTRSREGDVWFGSDVPRHVAWACGRWWDRSQWHPISAITFKVYGRLLRRLGWERCYEELVIHAVPVIIAAVLAIVSTAAMFARSSGRPKLLFAGYVLAAVVIGPVPVFASVPESHMIGGAALCIEALMLLRGVRLTRAGASRAAVSGPLAVATVSGALAIGFTLTNALPALALLLFPLNAGVVGRRWLLATAAAMALTIVLPLAILSSSKRIDGRWWHNVQTERDWSVAFGPASVQHSFRELVVNQFGVPPTAAVVWPGDRGKQVISLVTAGRASVLSKQFGIPPTTADVWWGDRGERVVSLITAGSASALPWAALLLWSAGIAGFLRAHQRQGPSDEKRFLFACLAALATVVGFHSFYAADEAYMFSAHAWPYVLLPGLVAHEDAIACGSRTRTLLFIAALAFAAAQSVLGWSLLVANLPLL